MGLPIPAKSGYWQCPALEIAHIKASRLHEIIVPCSTVARMSTTSSGSAGQFPLERWAITGLARPSTRCLKASCRCFFAQVSASLLPGGHRLNDSPDPSLFPQHQVHCFCGSDVEFRVLSNDKRP